MATKAAKSLTINATKFELANKLNIENGKLQLIAKDVVLDEIPFEAPSQIVYLDIGGFYIEDYLQSHSTFSFPVTRTVAFKDVNEETLTFAEFLDKALKGYTIIPRFQWNASSTDYAAIPGSEAKLISDFGQVEIYINPRSFITVGNGDDLRDFFSIILSADPDGATAITPKVNYIRKNFSTFTKFVVGDTFELVEADGDFFNPKYLEVNSGNNDPEIHVFPVYDAYNTNINIIGVPVQEWDTTNVTVTTKTLGMSKSGGTWHIINIA